MDRQHFIKKPSFQTFAKLPPPRPQVSPPGPQVTFYSLARGQLVSLKKFKSDNAKAEVSLLKLFKGVAANQYFQMCIYHAGREVTHGEQNKYRNSLVFHVQRV